MKIAFKKICSIVCATALTLSTFSIVSAADIGAGNDLYDQMRKKWEATLTGGDNYDRTDPYIAEKINSTSSKAQQYWDSMIDKSLWTEMGYIWSDLDITKLS